MFEARLPIRLIASYTGLFLICAAPAVAGVEDRAPAACIALDSARQRLESANYQVDIASRDLEFAVQNQHRAQHRLDLANSDFDVLENMMRDPNLMDQMLADARSAQQFATERAVAVQAARMRLEAASDAVQMLQPQGNPTTQPASPELVAAQANRVSAEREVVSLQEELKIAIGSSRQAQDRVQKLDRLYHSMGTAQGVSQGEQFIAKQDVDNTNQALSDAEQRFHQAVDEQSRAKWGLEAAEQEVRVAENDDRRNALDRPRIERDKLLHDREDLGLAPARRDDPTFNTFGADSERREVVRSREDALERGRNALDGLRREVINPSKTGSRDGK